MKYFQFVMFIIVATCFCRCKEKKMEEGNPRESSPSFHNKQQIPILLKDNVDYCISCNNDLKLALNYPDSVRSIVLSAFENANIKSISKFVNLQMIAVNKSPFLDFDIFFKQLSECKYLKEVSIQDCNMKNLPNSINNLVNMESLTIGDTLQTFPARFSNLPMLKELGLVCYQQVCKDIGEFKNLAVLDLWLVDNRIVPKEIFRLNNLKKMRICGHIKYVPVEIRNLKKLVDLAILTEPLKEHSANKKGYIYLKNLSRELPGVNVTVSYF